MAKNILKTWRKNLNITAKKNKKMMANWPSFPVPFFQKISRSCSFGGSRRFAEDVDVSRTKGHAIPGPGNDCTIAFGTSRLILYLQLPNLIFLLGCELYMQFRYKFLRLLIRAKPSYLYVIIWISHIGCALDMPFLDQRRTSYWLLLLWIFGNRTWCGPSIDFNAVYLYTTPEKPEAFPKPAQRFVAEDSTPNIDIETSRSSPT